MNILICEVAMLRQQLVYIEDPKHPKRWAVREKDSREWRLCLETVGCQGTCTNIGNAVLWVAEGMLP